MFARLCEQARLEIDSSGARGCYAKSVLRFHKKSGIPVEGLWAAAEAYRSGTDFDRLLIRMMKSFGGDPHDWQAWFGILVKEPDCRKAKSLS